MAQANRRVSSTSIRWDPDDQDEFMAAVRRLQAEGEIPTDIERSEAMRRLLNNWAENPDPKLLE